MRNFGSSGTRAAAESGVQAAGESAEEEASVGADGLRMRRTNSEDRAPRQPSVGEAQGMKPPPLHSLGTEERAGREASESLESTPVDTPTPSAPLMVSLSLLPYSRSLLPYSRSLLPHSRSTL